MNAVASLVASLSPEVLDLLAASYGKPAEAVVERATRKPREGKPSKLRAAKAKAEDNGSATAERKPCPVAFLPIALPPRGTYDARAFIRGVRNVEPIFVGNHEKVEDVKRVHDAIGNQWSFVPRRDEMIKLIAGYVGYDRDRDFGSQLVMARMQAIREIRGVVAAPSARPTLHGWITGVPNERAKRRGDLAARERLSGEAFAILETLVTSPADCSEDEIKLLCERFSLAPDMIVSQAIILRGVEEKRLHQIRADLAKA